MLSAEKHSIRDVLCHVWISKYLNYSIFPLLNHEEGQLMKFFDKIIGQSIKSDFNKSFDTIITIPVLSTVSSEGGTALAAG